jgi:maltose/moltooligosaccharide transporter
MDASIESDKLALTVGTVSGGVAATDGEVEPVAEFDRGKAVRYSVATFGSQAVFTLFTTGMSFFLASYTELRAQPELIGLLSNERAAVAAVAQPIVGRLSDRTRTPLGKRRPYMLIGIPVTAVSLGILATHPPFWLMLGILTIAAFFLWVALDPYNALVTDLFRPSQRGRVGGILGLVQMLGAITFLLFAISLWGKDQVSVFGLTIPVNGELLVFGVTIAVLLLTFGFTILTVKEPPLSPNLRTERVARVRPNPIAYMKDLFKYQEAVKYTLALTFFWIGNGGATPFLVLFGEKALRLSQSESFFLPLAFVIATALIAVPAGLLGDRIGKKWVLVSGLTIFGIAALIGSQSTNIVQAVIALFVIGIGNAGIGTMLIPLLADLIPHKRAAELIGLSSAITSFAQPVGSFLAGEVVVRATNIVGENDAYRWSFIFAGAMVVLAALFLLRVRPSRAHFDE